MNSTCNSVAKWVGALKMLEGKEMKRICINKRCLLRSFTTALSAEFAIITAVLLFFSLKDDLGITLDSLCKKCLALIIPVLLAGLFAVFRACTFRKNKIIDETQLSIILRYGNLWKYGFPRFCKKERIVVVNVNTAFDTIVDPPGVHNPLVSARTVHGQWIEQMKKQGVTPNELNIEIKKNLAEQKIVPSTVLNKDRGNADIYPKGTIALYQYKNTTFYLLALSEFDAKNNAQNTQEELRKTILTLIEFIGNYSQGYDVYIPVMGSGNSRTGIDDQTALELLSSNLKLNRRSLRGKINVVVYEKNRDKVKIEG